MNIGVAGLLRRPVEPAALKRTSAYALRLGLRNRPQLRVGKGAFCAVPTGNWHRISSNNAVGASLATLRFCAIYLFPKIRNFACRLTQISNICWPSRPSEGRCARYGRGAGCGGRGGACDERCRRGRRSRVVLTPRCWRQVCDKERRRRCQTSLVTGKSAK